MKWIEKVFIFFYGLEYLKALVLKLDIVNT